MEKVESSAIMQILRPGGQVTGSPLGSTPACDADLANAGTATLALAGVLCAAGADRNGARRRCRYYRSHPYTLLRHRTLMSHAGDVVHAAFRPIERAVGLWACVQVRETDR